ncbi:type I methionyl aminopeptidase [candidate division BRC1 bacterium HGW-BRC1-1]|jgi:methionyl aminopeptidase|nr:MAG: type I methionyl aminopeptidase [candidate division BRC1 bacterium HGW-BRC1-1]
MGTSGTIWLKSAAEIDKMRASGKLLRAVFNELEKHISPGVTTGELDRIAHKLIVDAGAKPAFLGYHGFPATLCTSVNEEIVHGFPGKRHLAEGDVVSIDCGLFLEDWCSDSAKTYPIGKVSDEVAQLLKVTQESLYAGIAVLKPDVRLGTLSAAIQAAIDPHGYGIVREYTGHGIGREMHEAPQVLNYGKTDTGMRLKAGTVIAIEPMVNIGTGKTKTLADGWTVISADKSVSAHFEHTVAITEDGPVILTA